MMRTITLAMVWLMLGFAAFAQPETTESPYRGFAGYAYGSGMDAIADDMEAAGYALIDSTQGSLWYDSTFLEIDCQLGYIFKDHTLVGGAMILGSATEDDFARVNNYLRTTYKSRVDIEVTDGIAVARIAGPDSAIIQTLDLHAGIHEIEYTQEK